LTGPILPGSFGKSSNKFMVVLEKSPRLSIIGLIHDKFHKFIYEMREASHGHFLNNFIFFSSKSLLVSRFSTFLLFYSIHKFRMKVAWKNMNTYLLSIPSLTIDAHINYTCTGKNNVYHYKVQFFSLESSPCRLSFHEYVLVVLCGD
jgi:hypothetical protein